MEHQFPRLEELIIRHTSTSIKTISVSSLSLKKITIAYIEGLEEANFDVPNLAVFVFKNCVNVVPKLSFAGNSRGWISRITCEFKNTNIDSSTLLKLREFLAVNATSTSWITVYFEGEFTWFIIEIDNHRPQISKTFTAATILHATMWRSIPEIRTNFSLLFGRRKIIDGILFICRPRFISVLSWPDCAFPKLIYDTLMDFKRFNDRNLTSIRVNKSQTQLPYTATLMPPQILDRRKFPKLFKLDYHDREALFDVIFELEYPESI